MFKQSLKEREFQIKKLEEQNETTVKYYKSLLEKKEKEEEIKKNISMVQSNAILEAANKEILLLKE